MPLVWCHLFLLVLLLLLVAMPDRTVGTITCSAVTSRLQTSVTCHFGQDIGDHNFNVQFFYPDLNAESEMPLVCNRGSLGELRCHIEKNVTFNVNQEVKDQLTFTRAGSLSHVGGLYRCEVVPPLGVPIQPCILTKIEIPISPERTTMPADRDGSDAIQIFLMAVAILFLAVFTILLICCVILYRKRESVTKWWAEHYTAGRLWPGAIGDPQDTEPESALSNRIPAGLPAFFFNMGWKEAMKEEKDETKDARPSDKQLPKADSTSGRSRAQQETNVMTFGFAPRSSVKETREKFNQRPVSREANQKDDPSPTSPMLLPSTGTGNQGDPNKSRETGTIPESSQAKKAKETTEKQTPNEPSQRAEADRAIQEKEVKQRGSKRRSLSGTRKEKGEKEHGRAEEEEKQRGNRPSTEM